MRDCDKRGFPFNDRFYCPVPHQGPFYVLRPVVAAFCVLPFTIGNSLRVSNAVS